MEHIYITRSPELKVYKYHSVILDEIRHASLGLVVRNSREVTRSTSLKIVDDHSVAIIEIPG